MRRLNNNLEYSINIRVDTVVMFLWLETDVEGHFEDNGLIVTEPQSTVIFVCEKHVPIQTLQESIKVQYYSN